MKWSFKNKFRKHLRRSCAITTFVALSALPLSPAAAQQTVTITDDIRFGFVRITDNTAPRQIELLPGSGFNADPEYIFYENPQIGSVDLTGFTPDTDISVTFVPPNGTLMPGNGMGPAFTIDSLFTNPVNIKTNGAGNASFDVGGILKSDGGGALPLDTDFTLDILIEVEEVP